MGLQEQVQIIEVNQFTYQNERKAINRTLRMNLYQSKYFLIKTMKPDMQ